MKNIKIPFLNFEYISYTLINSSNFHFNNQYPIIIKIIIANRGLKKKRAIATITTITPRHIIPEPSSPLPPLLGGLLPPLIGGLPPPFIGRIPVPAIFYP